MGLRAVLAAVICIVFGIGGCSPSPRAVVLADGSYAPAFEASQEVVRSLGFEVEQTDARSGVITTRPRKSAGFLTPLSQEQSTFEDEWTDAVNNQTRVVRIEFAPLAGGVGGDDLRSAAGPMVLTVSAVVYRLHTPGWQVETESPTSSRFARDRVLESRRMAPVYTVARRRDDWLAGRIASKIALSLGPGRARVAGWSAPTPADVPGGDGGR